jgi:hypothetical protein
MMDEAYSYGYSNIRDAATITPRQQIEPLVIPDDIMKLPSLRGFLVFPEGFDAARVQLHYKDYPIVAPAYRPRANVEPVAYIADDNEESSETGGREGSPEPTLLIEDNPVVHALSPDRISGLDDAAPDLEVAERGKPLDPVENTPERLAIEARTFRAGSVLPQAENAQGAGASGSDISPDEGNLPNDSRPVPEQFRLDLGRRELTQAFEPESKVERSVSGPEPTPGSADDGLEI